jgi:hypothetical protein
MTQDPIEKHIDDTAFYAGVSYRGIAEVAAEVESVVDETKRKEDVERRSYLRRRFKARHGLTAQVWARVPKWFDGAQVKRGEHAGLVIRDYTTMGEKEIRAASYLCQLPRNDFLNLYDAVQDNLEEHGAVLNQVNDVLAAIRATPARAKKATLAERIGKHVFNNDIATAHELICGEPEIARDLERREQEQGEAFPEVAAALKASAKE